MHGKAVSGSIFIPTNIFVCDAQIYDANKTSKQLQRLMPTDITIGANIF